MPSQLLERRPDIAAAERIVAAQNAQIGVAQAAFFPNLLINATGGWSTGSLSRFFSAPNLFWSLGAALAQTIFEGGKRIAAKEQAIANYDASVAAYRQSVLTSFQDVENNLAALRLLAEEAEQQARAAQAAERAVTLSRDRYEGGITIYLEVVTAQTAALSNERAVVQLQTRRMTVERRAHQGARRRLERVRAADAGRRALLEVRRAGAPASCHDGVCRGRGGRPRRPLAGQSSPNRLGVRPVAAPSISRRRTLVFVPPGAEKPPSPAPAARIAVAGDDDREGIAREGPADRARKARIAELLRDLAVRPRGARRDRPRRRVDAAVERLDALLVEDDEREVDRLAGEQRGDGVDGPRDVRRRRELARAGEAPSHPRARRGLALLGKLHADDAPLVPGDRPRPDRRREHRESRSRHARIRVRRCRPAGSGSGS